MLSRLSKYSYAVCQHKVLVPMCNLMTRRRPDKASAHIEITKLSSQSNLSYFNQQTRSFSEHFTPYDGKEKCPTKEIFMLVQHGSVEDLREWIETGGIDVNCRDEVRLLLNLTIPSINCCYEMEIQNMKTPLIVAAELNRSEMMKVLMEHGADVNLQDIFGKSMWLNNM